MPAQQIFFEAEVGNDRIDVIKTYDTQYAHEAFERMADPVKRKLWESLGISSNYEPEDLPKPDNAEWGDFLWQEIVDLAREDERNFSYFVVRGGKGAEPLFVSPDWPNAEKFAEELRSAKLI
jgi:hypothetical protein